MPLPEKRRKKSISRNSAVKIVCILFIAFLCLNICGFNGINDTVPASSNVIEDLALTVWSNGVAFNAGMTLELNVDFAVLYPDGIEITVSDLNGTFIETRMIPDPLSTANPQFFYHTVPIYPGYGEGVHIFEITTKRGISSQVQVFPVLFYPSQLAAAEITGLTLAGGTEETELDASAVYNLVTTGQKITISTSLSRIDSSWMVLNGKDTLVYFKEEIHYYYPMAICQGFYRDIDAGIEFRVPSSWELGIHEMIPVFTGSSNSLLATCEGPTVVIDVTTGVGMEIHCSADEIERNNNDQSNTLDFTVYLPGYAGQAYLLNVSLTDTSGMPVEQLQANIIINSSSHVFSYLPGDELELGFYTVTAKLYDPVHHYLVSSDYHVFKLLDKLITDSYFLDKEDYTHGDELQGEFYVREQDRPVAVSCSTLVKVDTTGDDDWLIISDRDSDPTGKVEFDWTIPEDINIPLVPIRIECWPFPTDSYHLSGITDTEGIRVVTETVISIDGPLSLFRGTTGLFSSSVYSAQGEPVITGGNISLYIDVYRVFSVEIDENNWNSIVYPWEVSLDYPVGIVDCRWEYSGNGYCNPSVKEFIVAVWSRPRIDSISVNCSYPVFGESVEITALIVDEMDNPPPGGASLIVEFSVTDLGDSSKGEMLLTAATSYTGHAKTIIDCSGEFFADESIYKIVISCSANNSYHVATSEQVVIEYLYLTEEFGFGWLNTGSMPVTGNQQSFFIAGRANDMFMLSMIDFSTGERTHIGNITLDSGGKYNGTIVFETSGNYSLHAEPSDPGDQHHFIPLEIEIFCIQYLSWNLYPVIRSDDLPVNSVIITNMTIILGEELEIEINTNGPYRLWLDDSLSLASSENRTYTYRFSQKGEYSIFLEAMAQDTWPINYSCIVTVLELIDLEVNFPVDVSAGQSVVISIICSCASEGLVRGVLVNMNLTDLQNRNSSFVGTSGSDGKIQFPTGTLNSGNYTITLNITVPTETYFTIIPRIYSPGNIIVWSSTAIQTNSFTAIQGKNVTLRAVVHNGEGNFMNETDVYFSYYAVDPVNSLFIGITRTSIGQAAFNWTVPNDPGDYCLIAETKDCYPYSGYVITVPFQVTGIAPEITNFGISYIVGNNGITFDATASVQSFNIIESVTFSLNGSIYYLTEITAGNYYQEFEAQPGNYMLTVVATDIYGLNDSYTTPFVLTTNTETTTITTSTGTGTSTNPNSSSGTGTSGIGSSGSIDDSVLGNLVMELAASAVLLGGGGAVFILKRRKDLFR